jgi:hypothetical protein
VRFCHIVPTSFVGEYAYSADGRHHMVLAQHVNGIPRYGQLYAEVGKLPNAFVILDNGAFEMGETCDLDDLVRAIELIEPHEVVLPDALRNRDKTLRFTEAAVKCLRGIGYKGGLMAVPQGVDKSEWIVSLFDMLRIPEVTTIGLFEELADWFDSRMRLLQEYGDAIRIYEKPIHLLGIDEGFVELNQIPTKFPYVRSMDTGKVVGFSRQGVVILPLKQNPVRTAYAGRPKDFFNLDVEPFKPLLLRNIKVIDAWLDNCEEQEMRRWAAQSVGTSVPERSSETLPQ